MKVNKYLVSKIVLALAIVFTVYFGFRLLSGIRLFTVTGKEFRQRQVRLLCETDYQALLDSCRELSRQVAGGKLKPGTYKIRRDPDPESTRFPQLILDLEPKYVVIYTDGQVKVAVEELGPYAYFGVWAYSEDYKKPKHDKKLINGLWYYDSDYYDAYPKYMKKIDALIQKGKMRRQAKQSRGND